MDWTGCDVITFLGLQMYKLYREVGISAVHF